MQNLDDRPAKNVVITEASCSTAHVNYLSQNHVVGRQADLPHLPPLSTETTKLAPIMMA